jgi:magnesium transporter
MLTVVRIENGSTTRVQDVSLLPEMLADRSRSFWVDFETPSDEEFALLDTLFHFHPLAVEDAMRPHQRPKVDEYDGYFFLVADEVILTRVQTDSMRDGHDEADEDEEVQSRQLAVFQGENYLVTVHVEPVAAVCSLRDRC